MSSLTVLHRLDRGVHRQLGHDQVPSAPAGVGGDRAAVLSAVVCSSAKHRCPGIISYLIDLHQRRTNRCTSSCQPTRRRSRCVELWANYVRHLAMQPGALGPRSAAVWRKFEEELSSTPSHCPVELKACEERFDVSYSPLLLRKYLTSIKYTERWLRELRRRRLSELHLISTLLAIV